MKIFDSGFQMVSQDMLTQVKVDCCSIIDPLREALRAVEKENTRKNV